MNSTLYRLPRCAIAFLLTVGAVADEPAKTKTRDLKFLLPCVQEVGDLGEIHATLPPTGNAWQAWMASKGRWGEFRTVRVLSKTELVVEETDRGNSQFVLRGVDTSKILTGRGIAIDGLFKAVKTANFAGKTLIVIEAASKEEKAARDERIAEETERERRRAAGAEEFAKFERELVAKRAAAAAAKKKREDDARSADGLLNLAIQFTKEGKPEKAIERLRKIVKDYADTPAAKEASELLKKLAS
jgi:hypothetical protein